MGRMTSDKEKKEQLFGHNYHLVASGNSVRFAPFADNRTYNLISTESSKMGISKTDYLLYRLLSADMDKLLDLQYLNPEIINACRIKNNVNRSRDKNGCFKKREGEVCHINPEFCRSHRVNMRVSSDCKKEIERRAEELSLNTSEFVTLVFLYYDFKSGY